MAENIPISLRKADIDPDPIRQFGRWLHDAGQSGGPQPDAMTLATADREGRPAARIVLLRGLDQRGFVFFTNYRSRKGEELEQNPAAALVFHWPELARQVRIEGRVEQVAPEESDIYFASRPREHKLGAHASPQSRAIPDRNFLEIRFKQAEQRFANRAVPRPPHWGGYRLVPDLVEFWQQGEHRLHDRLRYRRDTDGTWAIERLAP